MSNHETKTSVVKDQGFKPHPGQATGQPGSEKNTGTQPHSDKKPSNTADQSKPAGENPTGTTHVSDVKG